MCREDGALLSLSVWSIEELLQKQCAIIYTDIVQPRRSQEAGEVLGTEAYCPKVTTGTVVAQLDWIFNEHIKTSNLLEII